MFRTEVNCITGEITQIPLTEEEIAAAQAAAAAEQAQREAGRGEALYQGAIQWQEKTCDANKVALLTTIRALGNPRPKAAAALAWWSALWAERDARVASGSFDSDFSTCGDCPHTYREIVEEAQA